MKLKDLLQTANAGLRRSKARTLLTVLAIFIGTTTLTLTNGIGTGIKSYLTDQVSTLGSDNVLQIIPSASAGTTDDAKSGPAIYASDRRVSPNGAPLMTARDVAAIQSIPHVQIVVPDYTIVPDYVMGKSGKYVIQTVSQELGVNNSNLVAGTEINNATTQNQIALPQDYVASMGYGEAHSLVGKEISIGLTDASGQQHAVSAVVSGVLSKSLLARGVAYINTPLAEQLHTVQSMGLPAASTDSYPIVLASFSSDFTPAQLAAVKSALQAKGYTGRTAQDTQHTFFTIVNAIIVVLDAFGVITLLAASFGIINTLYMAVQERTREIGLMKALGMSQRKVFMLFSIEAILIGFLGSVSGVLFAALVGKGVNVIAANGFLKGVPGLTLLTFPFSTIVAVILGIMLLAFLAGTLPARRASKKNPIDALRYE
jgi:putative ABC transport system permease protein